MLARPQVAKRVHDPRPAAGGCRRHRPTPQPQHCNACLARLARFAECGRPDAVLVLHYRCRGLKYGPGETRLGNQPARALGGLEEGGVR